MNAQPQPLMPRALDGVRVIDLTDVSCVYATKILSDLGADVIRIEPPGGDPMRNTPPVDPETGASAFHAYMNANKRSVTLDLETESGRALFRKLVGASDMVFESLPPGKLAALGVDYDSFEDSCPGLVWASVTPFGRTGPYAGFKADDLISQAMGGFMTLSGIPDREPLRLCGEQTSFVVGLHAASGAMIALWHAMATGEGQHVDMSVHEAVAHTLESAIQVYTTEGRIRERLPRSSEAGVGVFPCTDGEIFVYANVGMIARSWENLVKWMIAEGLEGAKELADPIWEDLVFRRTEEARRKAAAVILQLTRTRSKYQIYDQLQQRNILCAPVSKVGDLFNNPQLKFLDWFVDQPIEGKMATWPGPAFRMSETPRRQPGFVRATGADNKAVYCELLGLAEAELATMAKEKAL